MMAMKFFQPALRLTKGLELDIWRESNLVESYGTSKEGLAAGCCKTRILSIHDGNLSKALLRRRDFARDPFR